MGMTHSGSTWNHEKRRMGSAGSIVPECPCSPQGRHSCHPQGASVPTGQGAPSRASQAVTQPGGPTLSLGHPSAPPAAHPAPGRWHSAVPVPVPLGARPGRCHIPGCSRAGLPGRCFCRDRALQKQRRVSWTREQNREYRHGDRAGVTDTGSLSRVRSFLSRATSAWQQFPPVPRTPAPAPPLSRCLPRVAAAEDVSRDRDQPGG